MRYDFRVSSGGKNVCSQGYTSDDICGNFLKALLEIFVVGGILHCYDSYWLNNFNIPVARDKADAL